MVQYELSADCKKTVMILFKDQRRAPSKVETAGNAAFGGFFHDIYFSQANRKKDFTPADLQRQLYVIR
jgi:hypothetical protein